MIKIFSSMTILCIAVFSIFMISAQSDGCEIPKVCKHPDIMVYQDTALNLIVTVELPTDSTITISVEKDKPKSLYDEMFGDE